MRSLTFAMLFATISTPAIASTNYTQDARDLSAAALCGATNVTCQQSYTSGAKDGTAAYKRVLSTYKAIRAAEVPPPPPAPPPSPPPPAPALSGVTSEGDSISVLWSGNHVGIWKASRPDVTLKSLAVGGSGLNNLIARKANIGTPKVFTVLIGANDLTGYASGKAYADAVVAYVGPVRATGAKVAVGTILPQVSTNSAYQLKFDAYRAEYNATIKASPAIDAVIDFGAPQLQADGVHPTDAGQAAMAPAYKAVVDALLAGQTVPPPSPPPVPPPVIDPAIPTSGLAMVSDGLDVASLLKSAGKMPDLAAPGDPGAFRLICHASHLSYNDPIVYPGKKGKSHLHQFFGNDSVDENSTYDSLRKAGNSTCGNALNRSGYWMPALLNGKGGVVVPDFVTIYYKRYDVKSVQCTQAAKACVQLPRGLRYIFGYDMINMAGKKTGGGYFNCDNFYMPANHPNKALVKPGHYKSIVEAGPNCPIGSKLGAVISSPDCWNGKDLDSPDHRSHMAYQSRDPNTGQMRCPTTHPYMVAQFTLGAWFEVDADLNRSGVWDGTFNSWHLSSDDMPGMPMLPGTTFHTDWFGAWGDSILNLWHINCIEKLKSCTAAEIGDGTQLKQPPDSWVAVPHVVPVPPHP